MAFVQDIDLRGEALDVPRRPKRKLHLPRDERAMLAKATRDAMFLKLEEAGFVHGDIAHFFGLTTAHVRRCIADAKAAAPDAKRCLEAAS